MIIPLEITFRDMGSPVALTAKIRKHVDRLGLFIVPITSCRVLVEARGRRHKANLYHVQVNVALPGAEITASRDPKDHRSQEDAYLAVHDAFRALERRLEDCVYRRRGQARNHRSPRYRRTREALPAAAFGLTESSYPLRPSGECRC